LRAGRDNEGDRTKIAREDSKKSWGGGGGGGGGQYIFTV